MTQTLTLSTTVEEDLAAYVWCDVHGTVHAREMNPYDMAGGNECNPTLWRTLLFDAASITLPMTFEERVEVNRQYAPNQLLEWLSATGFSWKAVTELTGLSSYSIRKGRDGQRLTADQHRTLVRTVSTVEELEVVFGVENVASFFDTVLGALWIAELQTELVSGAALDDLWDLARRFGQCYEVAT